MTPKMLGGAVRAILAALGGYLVAQGLLDDETAQQLAGAGAVIVVAIWSIFTKARSSNRDRVQIPPLAGLAALAMAAAIVSLGACTPAAQTGPVATAPAVPIADRTAADEKALTLAARSVTTMATVSRAMVKAGAIKPGSPLALRLAELLDTARDALNAAQTARQALGAPGYAEAIERATTAAEQIAALIEGK